MSIKVLAVGDVCGEPGLDFLDKRLKAYRKENNIDFVVVNGENANVVGITPRQADQIFRAGADVITLGNHTWTRTELRPYLDERRKILRPANFGPQCPGRGIAAYSMPFGDVCVLNLMGRFTLDTNTDNPFVIADGYMEEIKEKIILVDFHAEGTSEKRAMGYLLDGRVSAVWGTHTHVQTSDAGLLPKGPFWASTRSSPSASLWATRPSATPRPRGRRSWRAACLRSTRRRAVAGRRRRCD